MTDIFISDETLIDRLIAHFKTGGKAESLTGKEAEQWEIIETAENLLNQHRRSTAISLLKAKYPTMHTSTAYRYCEFAERILGPMKTINKDWWRFFLLDKAMATFDFAKQKGDARAMVGALREAKDISGVAREDLSVVDPSKLQRHNNVIVFIGGDKDMKQLTLPEIQKLPVSKQKKILEQISEAMQPVDTDFIEDAKKKH